MSASIREIVRNNVKEKLARNEVVASLTVRLVHSIEIARIAKTAGFDSIYVDVEHSSLSLETAGQICLAALVRRDHAERAAEFVKMGARYVSTGTDLAFLLAAAAEKAKQVRDIDLR